jgi:RNA polymerase sigma factor (sigma-70 family)
VLVDRSDAKLCVSLFEQHREQLQRYVRRLVSQEDEVTDIVQEVGVRLLSQPTMPSGEQRFGAWCKAVARHVVLHERRATRYRQALRAEIESAHRSDVFRPQVRAAIRFTVLRQLEGIDPLSQELLVRRYVLEQTSDEISRDIQLSAAAVRMRLMRLREALTAALGPEDAVVEEPPAAAARVSPY